jgi:hypothetical protein
MISELSAEEQLFQVVLVTISMDIPLFPIILLLHCHLHSTDEDDEEEESRIRPSMGSSGGKSLDHLSQISSTSTVRTN